MRTLLDQRRHRALVMAPVVPAASVGAAAFLITGAAVSLCSLYGETCTAGEQRAIDTLLIGLLSMIAVGVGMSVAS